MACPIAGQVMITVFIRKRLAPCRQCYDLLQQLYLQAALDGSLVVFFETGCVLEYSRAVTPQIRQTGNRLSGNAETAYASLLA